MLFNNRSFDGRRPTIDLPITRRPAHSNPHKIPAIRTPKAVGCMGLLDGGFAAGSNGNLLILNEPIAA
jgi:hypothetical protein